MLYGLIKKLSKFAALAGVALLIAGGVSILLLNDFEEKKAETSAYITVVEEGGLFDNGYVVKLRYTVGGTRYDGELNSGDLGERWKLIEAEAEAAGLDVIDYVDTKQLFVDICYNSEVPESIKYAEYVNPANDFFVWGGWMLGGGIVVGAINGALRKKKEEREAEKRVEKKQAKEQARQR